MLLKKLPLGIALERKQRMNKANEALLNKYVPIIGLEIHVELKTKSKMFCACKNDPFGAKKPNIYTCHVCLGAPAALPVANKKAIEWTIKLGLALGSKINQFSKFDRKHYFYPDLPKGYQISQYDRPFCVGGKMMTSEGEVLLERIHLEEDTGKMLHKTIDGKKVSLIDFNRSGVPLVEIVTKPVIKSSSQASEYAKNLRQLIRDLEIADCDMQKGGMRLEANISLLDKEKYQLDPKKSLIPLTLPSYKVEIKNINSFKFLKMAIEEEILRQAEILTKGKIPEQETRGWDASKSKSFSQRVKEEAADYRYFPDPDLPAVIFSDAEIQAIKASLPELAIERNARLAKTFQLDMQQISRLASNQEKAKLLEEVLSISKKSHLDTNKIINAWINKKITVTELMKANEIIAAFEKSHKTEQIDQNLLKMTVEQVLTANPDAISKYQSGKTQVIGFLIGQVMREIKIKIDPQIVRQLLMELLNK